MPYYIVPTEVLGLVAELIVTSLWLKPSRSDKGSQVYQYMLSGRIVAATATGCYEKKGESPAKIVDISKDLINMGNRPCVFIVDDDDAVRDGLEMVINTLGLDCQTFASAEQFLKGYCYDKPGCLLLDYKLPGMNGLELQAELKRRNMQLPIIFLTAHGNSTMGAMALEAGAFGFLTKPAQIGKLVESIRAALLHV